jgi:hypothetical protein
MRQIPDQLSVDTVIRLPAAATPATRGTQEFFHSPERTSVIAPWVPLFHSLAANVTAGHRSARLRPASVLVNLSTRSTWRPLPRPDAVLTTLVAERVQPSCSGPR